MDIFHSGILELFEENFHQDIKLHTIYFSLTDQNVRTTIILFSVHLSSLRICLVNLCGICDLFIHIYHVTTSPVS